MFRFYRAVLAFVLMFCVAPSVGAQVKFDLSGFANYQNLGEGRDLGWTRITPTLDFNVKFVVTSEIEFSEIDDNVEQMEWLSQLNVSFKASPSTTIMVGRTFRAFGYVAPAPVTVRTAEYPGGYPFSGYYAYGVRIDKSHKSNLGTLSFKGDVVLEPVGFRTFNLSQPEVSLYSGFNVKVDEVSAGLSIAGQFSEKYRRAGFSANSNSRRYSVFGGLFYNSDQKSHVSATSFMEGHLGFVHPHTQCSIHADNTTQCLAGTAMIFNRGGHEFKLIADYTADGWLWRTQFRY